LISVKAIVKGEDDVPPFIRVFEYLDTSDEIIFLNSLSIIREKLTKNLKINTNEALMYYCNYIVSHLRTGISVGIIEREAKRLLSAEDVMIGVPETLRKIIFEASIDHMPKQILKICEPVLVPKYVLTAGK
jgi:urease gamma subunit